MIFMRFVSFRCWLCLFAKVLFGQLGSSPLVGIRGGVTEGGRPPTRAWTFSGQTLFSVQVQVARKSWMIQNISIQWKIPGQFCFHGKCKFLQNLEWQKVFSIQGKSSGHTLFFRASTSCSNILNVKIIFNTVNILRTSASCSKIVNGEKCSIQCIFTWGWSVLFGLV